MSVAKEILNKREQQLFEDLNKIAGGCSDAKKYAPLLNTGVVRSFNHLGKTYVVSFTHPQFTIMYRIPIVSVNIMRNPVEKAKFDNGQKIVSKWIMGEERVTPDLLQYIRMFFKRHSSTHCIISIPMAFRKEFLADLKQTDAPYVQVSIDYKNEVCPRCAENNEIPQNQKVVFCSSCGSEFAAQEGY